jgi:phosphatidylglycerol---prolipoprotein diacylglyceryl transferase
VSPAVLTFSFDPLVHLGPTASVRLETLALAAVLFLGLVLTGVIARRTPAVGPYVPAPTLRPDDLIFIAIGVVPGALLGGRLGYVLDNLAYYKANPAAITDFSQGALSLTLAVPLGILTGAIIARLIGAPVARWMHASALPLLLVLGGGKLAGVLGASGQGLPSDVSWATAYVGAGPWGALAPDVPAHPAQVYEALLIVVAILGLLLSTRLEVVARRDGAALFVALGLWSVARLVVAFTWRDPAVIGPLRVDQVLAILLVALAVLGLLERSRAPSRAGDSVPGELEPQPAK